MKLLYLCNHHPVNVATFKIDLGEKKNIHHRIIHKSHKVETTQMSVTDEWINKM